MKTLKTLTLAFLLPVLLTVNAQENRKITVFTIGDSTMANKDTTDQNPERGWAMAFQALFNADFVTVDNHAVNGRSSKSFFDEGRWQKVLDLLREGDYVFIQFGHNDEKTQDAKRYTDPATTFREFLTKYVTETRSKGATPVLLTPIARRKFSDENGFPLDTHGDYPAAMREVSKSLDVPLIDMTELTGRMLLVMGKEDSKRLFMHLQPGQVKKYPNGLQDDTHLNEYGAAYIARMVAGAIRNQQLPLAKYLTRDISSMNWGAVAGSMPEEWYGSAEAETVAENVLLYQRNTGGWQKNTPFHQKLSENDRKTVLAAKDKRDDSTIDNDATTTEIVFLSKIYNATGKQIYKDAAIKGINYLLEAQYSNGGWAQYYPLVKGYYTHITYNDNAMVSVMNMLKSIAAGDKPFAFLTDKTLRRRCQTAFDKGVDCILKTQYRQNGILTVWCAQYDENTLLPAKARAYELPSLSGSESVGIVRLLMNIKNPSKQVQDAIKAALAWFEKNSITGIKIETYTNADGKRDRRAVNDPTAPPLWARFYELDTNRPFFCDRDGIPKYSLAEIGYERRNGYSWYTNAPSVLLK